MHRFAALVFAIAFFGQASAFERSGATSVLAQSAVCDGKTDDTQAIRKAIATGLPVHLPTGRCRVTDILEFQDGQMVYGDGRTRSVITVDRGFNMTAAGIVRLGNKEPGADLRDMGIEFEQPDADTRDAMIKYPPAILAKDLPRFRISNVRLSGAWVGIDATGNTGGAFISDIENGSIRAGILFDHPRDFVHITSYHSWPFGFQDSNRLKAWSDGQTIAADFRNIDGLDVKGWNTFKARTLVSGTTFGSMTGVNLDDDFSRIEMSGGHLSIGQVWKSTRAPGDFFIRLTGGRLNLSAFQVHGKNQQVISAIFMKT